MYNEELNGWEIVEKKEYAVIKAVYYPVFFIRDTMVQRSFHINATAQSLNGLANAIDEKGINLSNVDVARNCPSLYGMNAAPDMAIQIKNGWKQKRFGFIILLIVVTRVNGIVTKVSKNIIEGYTEHTGHIVHNGRLIPDPNNQHTINRIRVETSNVVTTDGHTREVSTPPRSFVIVHDPLTGTSKFTLDRSDLRVMRPTDIASNLFYKTRYQDVSIKDYSSTVENNLNETATVNSNPTNVVSTIMTKAIESKTLIDSQMTDPNRPKTNIYSNMTSRISEFQIESVEFIQGLSEIYGFITNQFFMKDVVRSLLPGFSNVCHLTDPKKLSSDIRSMRDVNSDFMFSEGSDLAQATDKARIASTLAEALGPIMETRSIYSLGFSFSYKSRVFGFKPLSEPKNPVFTFHPSQVKSVFDAIGSLINALIVPLVTLGNPDKSFEIVCYYDKLNESRIGITFPDEMNPVPEIFPFPTFASGTYNPAITRPNFAETELNDWAKTISLVTNF